MEKQCIGFCCSIYCLCFFLFFFLYRFHSNSCSMRDYLKVSYTRIESFRRMKILAFVLYYLMRWLLLAKSLQPKTTSAAGSPRTVIAEHQLSSIMQLSMSSVVSGLLITLVLHHFRLNFCLSQCPWYLNMRSLRKHSLSLSRYLLTDEGYHVLP